MAAEYVWLRQKTGKAVLHPGKAVLQPGSGAFYMKSLVSKFRKVHFMDGLVLGGSVNVSPRVNSVL